MRRLSLAAILVLGAGLANGDVVSSTFDSDAEGWAPYGDGTDFAWNGAEGNPPGSIYAKDKRTGVLWGFSAPEKFLGDKSAFIGGSLAWDMKVSDTGDAPDADITLTGSGLTLVTKACLPEADKWVRRAFALKHDAGWKVDKPTGAAATEEQFASVMAALESIDIRAEYSSATDFAYMDNVRLATPDQPYCYADCNIDCKTDVNDFICFQGKWRAKDPFGDHNKDGRWNINDFIAFQADFRLGCR